MKNMQSRLAEQAHFFTRMVASPRGVGSVVPSGRHLARAMAAWIDPARPGPVLELGPGSGSMTRAMLDRGLPPDRLTVVERDPEFVARIRENFPGVTVIHGDALDLEKTIGRTDVPFSAVMSGIPLLNLPAETRRSLVREALSRLEPGAPFIQFTYGLHSPLRGMPGVRIEHAAFVLRNMPPANVWIYRQADQDSGAEAS